MRWVPWVLFVAVLATAVPLLVILAKAYEAEHWRSINKPRPDARAVRYEQHWTPGTPRSATKLYFGDTGPCLFAVDMDGKRIATIWCFLEWTEDGFDLEPYLYNDSAVELFRDYSLDPRATIVGVKEGDKLTFTGVWGELITEPLYLVPPYDENQ